MVKGALGVLATENAPKAGAGHGGAAPAQPAAAAKADVNTTLGDMWVKSDVPSVKAGKVSFSTKNTGATMHGLAIAEPGGEKLLAHGKHLQPGESDTFTATLKPGRYELICHVSGHYAAGQKMPFTVK
jgi:uncharacterized cupredoxin-like copper-binding protein